MGTEVTAIIATIIIAAVGWLFALRGQVTKEQHDRIGTLEANYAAMNAEIHAMKAELRAMAEDSRDTRTDVREIRRLLEEHKDRGR